MIWKILAIIFMCLTVLFLGLGIWAGVEGTKIIEQENFCAYDVCLDYPSYYYDDYNELCSCFDSTGELHKTKYMGG